MESLINFQEDISLRITKAKTNFKKSPKDRITKEYVEGRLDSLESLWSDFRSGHKELMQTIEPKVLKKEKYVTEELYETTEDIYMEYKCELKTLLSTFVSVDEHQGTASRRDASAKSSHVKLPKISIPTFSGKYTEWTTFRDLFVSMIHGNDSLDNVQKLHYLKGFLTGEAEQLLRHIPITGTNYGRCWTLLEERYNNKKFMSHCILKRFLGQRTATSESASFLKDLIDTSSDCLSALSNLGVDIGSWDIIVIHILSLKLDPESRKQWELSVTSNTTSDTLPTFIQFKEFLTSRYRALEFIESKVVNKSFNRLPQGTNDHNKPKVLHVSNMNKMLCEFCREDHKLCFCKRFANEGYAKRREFVTENRICFNCLGSNHSVRFCQKATSCRVCGGRHHSLLHPGVESTSSVHNRQIEQAVEAPVAAVSVEATDSGDEEVSPIITCFSKGEVKGQVLLATALIKAEAKTGEYEIIRALLDQGSQASFVTESTIQRLGLKKVPVNSLITGLGGDQSSVVSKHMARLKVKSVIDSNFELEIWAYVLKKITTYLPTERVIIPDWVRNEQIQLADPNFHTPNKIDILLGASVYSQVLQEGLKRRSSVGLVAQRTTLGWIISGPTNATGTGRIAALHAQVQDDELLKQFWELEDHLFNKNKIFTEEEQKCERFFAATTRRDKTGRYVVKLPFRDQNPLCKGGNSREVAVRRLRSLERKLSKDKELKARYTNVINEYLQLEHMAIIPEPDVRKSEAVYLPHHAVIREDKSTTKLRVVFDASCKNENGVSLNDTLMIGPTLQPELRHLIMRWRRHSICLCADIVKMYRMIRVDEEDTEFQRIVWRNSPEEDIRDYKLLTVTFGTASAPYLAVKALMQLAEDEKDRYPTAARRVSTDYYMDDLMTGCESLEEGVQLYREMNALLQRGGFQMQKWTSNNDELLQRINDKKDRDEEQELSKENLEIKTDNIVKILGLTWHRREDIFQYSVSLPSMSKPVTKRTIISDISRLYDPLGWIAPSVIVAKIFIQKLWIKGIDWDEEAPENIKKDWLTYREELAQLVNFQLPRWVHTNADIQTVELHGFCDASNAAYAGVVYLRVVDSTGAVKVSLITAKTRVAPIKQVTIPRLELCGAVILTRLLSEVAEVMNIPMTRVHAWTDSTVVLAWLSKHPSHWKTFVANRVSEILTTLNSSHWSHVPTKDNPADCASRGISPSELCAHQLWRTGPSFLRDQVISYKKPHSIETKLEQTTSSHTVTMSRSIFDRFSSLKRLIRVVAYCRRFITKSKRAVNKPREEFLTEWELNEALTCCIKLCQKEAYKKEMKEIQEHGVIITKSSDIISLTPYMDAEGVLRLTGRIQQSEADEDTKHPIILPHNSRLTHLIISDAHNVTLHGGPQLMLQYLRTAYWIVRAKSAVKQHVRRCVKCFRYKANSPTQLMGSLPPARVIPARAFRRSGVDYAGPINLRTSKGRGHHAYKGYICLFVCMVTKAIHIEVVSDLTSRGFLEAFKRFVARRGHCAEVWSDNGTNFIGASKDLGVLSKAERATMHKEVAEALAMLGTTWHFIPPRAPNFGGLWEAGVKATKHHIRRVIGDSTLTFEEMTTLTCQIEACLNSRPISILTTDPEEATPLTPGHFLVGEPLITVPEKNYETGNISCLRRWQLTQRMLQTFWRRWSNEYLTHCSQRYKWARIIPEPKVGDVVLVKEDDLPPARWLLGKIVEKHPGPDGITRVVSLKCKKIIMKRPVSKVCVLPLAE